MIITGEFSEDTRDDCFVYRVPNAFAFPQEFLEPNFPKLVDVVDFLESGQLGNDDVCIVLASFGKFRDADVEAYRVVSLWFRNVADQVLSVLRFRGRIEIE